jgi:hypothetical protein
VFCGADLLLSLLFEPSKKQGPLESRNLSGSPHHSSASLQCLTRQPSRLSHLRVANTHTGKEMFNAAISAKRPDHFRERLVSGMGISFCDASGAGVEQEKTCTPCIKVCSMQRGRHACVAENKPGNRGLRGRRSSIAEPERGSAGTPLLPPFGGFPPIGRLLCVPIRKRDHKRAHVKNIGQEGRKKTCKQKEPGD